MSREAQPVAAASSLASASETTGAATAPAFEQTLRELEGLVTQLESGDLPLDEALRTFERGVHLTRECQAALSAAQQKVQLLLQRGEGVLLEEFDRGAVEPGSAAATGVDLDLEP